MLPGSRSLSLYPEKSVMSVNVNSSFLPWIFVAVIHGCTVKYADRCVPGLILTESHISTGVTTYLFLVQQVSTHNSITTLLLPELIL